MGTPKKKLTPRQARFVKEYVKDLNATQAAIRAGYNPNTAQEQSSRLLSKVMVRQAVEEQTRKIESKIEIDSERILTELCRIAFSNVSDFIRWDSDGIVFLKPSDQIPRELLACIDEVSQTTTMAGTNVRFKVHDKLKALRMLGEYKALFTKKVEHTGKDGGAIEIDDLRGLTREQKKQRLSQIVSSLNELGEGDEDFDGESR